MYKIIYSNRADNNINDAKIFYENRKEGLGQEFYEELTKRIKNQIAKHPKFAKNIYKNIRQVSLNRFPYKIRYTINEKEKQVQIIAVTHDKRKPEYN